MGSFQLISRGAVRFWEDTSPLGGAPPELPTAEHLLYADAGNLRAIRLEHGDVLKVDGDERYQIKKRGWQPLDLGVPSPLQWPPTLCFAARFLPDRLELSFSPPDSFPDCGIRSIAFEANNSVPLNFERSADGRFICQVPPGPFTPWKTVSLPVPGAKPIVFPLDVYWSPEAVTLVTGANELRRPAFDDRFQPAALLFSDGSTPPPDVTLLLPSSRESCKLEPDPQHNGVYWLRRRGPVLIRELLGAVPILHAELEGFVPSVVELDVPDTLHVARCQVAFDESCNVVPTESEGDVTDYGPAHPFFLDAKNEQGTIPVSTDDGAVVRNHYLQRGLLPAHADVTAPHLVFAEANQFHGRITAKKRYGVFCSAISYAGVWVEAAPVLAPGIIAIQGFVDRVELEDWVIDGGRRRVLWFNNGFALTEAHAPIAPFLGVAMPLATQEHLTWSSLVQPASRLEPQPGGLELFRGHLLERVFNSGDWVERHRASKGDLIALTGSPEGCGPILALNNGSDDMSVRGFLASVDGSIQLLAGTVDLTRRTGRPATVPGLWMLVPSNTERESHDV